MKIIYLIVALMLSFVSCSGGKKQTLDAEPREEKGQIVTADFSSIEAFRGERKNEIRRVDPASLPIIVDISGNIELKDLDINNLSPNVNYVKLQHPKNGEGKRFIIRNTTMPMPSLTEELSQASFFTRLIQGIPRPTFLETKLYKGWILVGNLSGLFC